MQGRHLRTDKGLRVKHLRIKTRKKILKKLKKMLTGVKMIFTFCKM